jgi:hypothetical protein
MIRGYSMRIAARMAVQSAGPDRRRKERFAVEPAAPIIIQGYHGGDIVIVELSEAGFKAQAATHIPPKSIVRLKVPGLGTVVARIIWSRNGVVGGEFVNPVGEGRLRLVPGFGNRMVAREI